MPSGVDTQKSYMPSVSGYANINLFDKEQFIRQNDERLV